MLTPPPGQLSAFSTAARSVQTLLVDAVWQMPLVRTPPACTSAVLLTVNTGADGSARAGGAGSCAVSSSATSTTAMIRMMPCVDRGPMISTMLQGLLMIYRTISGSHSQGVFSPGLYSTAPMSHAAPCGLDTPRWSG